jgi:uncharacterized membrane protein YkvA (DUF1232 family)
MFARITRLLKIAGRDTLVLWYACRHPATPRKLKLVALLAMLYVVSPFDILPEALPLIGLIDDVTLLAFGIPALLRLLPDAAIDDAKRSAQNLTSRFRLWPRRS